MADYTLVKDPDRKTGQLPDKLTIRFDRNFAWWLVKQLIICLSGYLEEFSIELLGTIEKQ